MADKAVFGIATSEAQAQRIANQLKAAGFSGNDISVLFPDKAGSRDFAHEQHTKAPEEKRAIYKKLSIVTGVRLADRAAAFGYARKAYDLAPDDPAMPGWVEGKVDSLYLAIHEQLKPHAQSSASEASAAK